MHHIPEATPSASGDNWVVTVTIRDGDGRATARRVHRAIRSSLQGRRTTAEFHRIHFRLLAAGADGRADLQKAVDRLVRPELLSQLRGRWRRADREDAIVMGVDDALLKYFMNPMLYVPGRGDAVAWFLRIARNNVLDAFRRQGRPEKVERALGVRIEEAVPETAQAASSDAESRDVKNRELLARLLLAAHTNAERRYLRLKFSGASLAGQAAALGAATVPPSAQRVVVHRAWGRIKRRAERHGMIVPRRAGRRCA